MTYELIGGALIGAAASLLERKKKRNEIKKEKK